jgi:hypothetical protein
MSSYQIIVYLIMAGLIILIVVPSLNVRISFVPLLSILYKRCQWIINQRFQWINNHLFYNSISIDWLFSYMGQNCNPTITQQ